jgi:hypothetical protein
MMVTGVAMLGPGVRRRLLFAVSPAALLATSLAACTSPSVGLDGGVSAADVTAADTSGAADVAAADTSGVGAADAQAWDVDLRDAAAIQPDALPDADGGVGAEQTVSLAEFCRRFARTYVDRHAAVCSGDADELLRQWHTGLECDQDLLESVSAGRIAYSATQAQSCLDHLESGLCSSAVFPSILEPWTQAAACRGTFTPAVGEGGACRSGECADGLECQVPGLSGSDCSYRCRALAIAPPGARCGAPWTYCGPNARCGYDEAVDAIVCMPVVRAGGACARPTDCAFGTRCEENVCRTYVRASLGQDCSDQPCELHLRCGPQRLCVPRPRIGEPCMVDMGECGGLATCAARSFLDTEGVCTPVSGIGGDCSQRGQRCGQGACGRGNRCAMRGAVGEPCLGDIDCEVFCDHGICGSVTQCEGS